MNLDTFIAQLKIFKKITLIGPLLKPGAFPTPDGPLLYIDGGLAFRKKSQFPEFSIGDGDSTPLKPDLLLPSEKDASDLSVALQNLPQHLEQVHLLGFLGGRRDHELINFGEVHNFLLSRKASTEVWLDQQVWGGSAGTWRHCYNGLFSTICFVQAELKITGKVRFPLLKSIPIRPMSSLGLSNEGSGDFETECSKPCFIFFN